MKLNRNKSVALAVFFASLAGAAPGAVQAQGGHRNPIQEGLLTVLQPMELERRVDSKSLGESCRLMYTPASIDRFLEFGQQYRIRHITVMSPGVLHPSLHVTWYYLEAFSQPGPLQRIECRSEYEITERQFKRLMRPHFEYQNQAPDEVGPLCPNLRGRYVVDPARCQVHEGSRMIVLPTGHSTAVARFPVHRKEVYRIRQHGCVSVIISPYDDDRPLATLDLTRAKVDHKRVTYSQRERIPEEDLRGVDRLKLELLQGGVDRELVLRSTHSRRAWDVFPLIPQKADLKSDVTCRLIRIRD